MHVQSPCLPNAAPQVHALQDQTANCAMSCIQQCGYASLRKVQCDFHEGVLTLRGTVPSFFLKQVAQTAVRHIDDVDIVHNRIRVAEAVPESYSEAG